MWCGEMNKTKTDKPNDRDDKIHQRQSETHRHAPRAGENAQTFSVINGQRWFYCYYAYLFRFLFFLLSLSHWVCANLWRILFWSISSYFTLARVHTHAHFDRLKSFQWYIMYWCRNASDWFFSSSFIHKMCALHRSKLLQPTVPTELNGFFVYCNDRSKELHTQNVPCWIICEHLFIKVYSFARTVCLANDYRAIYKRRRNNFTRKRFERKK